MAVFSDAIVVRGVRVPAFMRPPSDAARVMALMGVSAAGSILAISLALSGDATMAVRVLCGAILALLAMLLA